MDDEPKALYEQHEKHGATGKGLMIGDEYRYAGRIGIGVGIIGALQPGSVLDIGCGYADLASSLPPYACYVGIDYTDWIAQEGRRRHPGRAIHTMSLYDFWKQFEPPPKYDLVVALGLLATMHHGEAVSFCEKVMSLSDRHVLISYLDRGVYTGRLYSYSIEDLDQLMEGYARRTMGLYSPKDDLNKAVLYERSGWGV